MLAIAALGLVIARTGLLPAKITALGIEFSQVQQQAMLTMVAAFLANFAVTFAVYAVADYFAWRKKQEISALASVGKRHGMQFDRLVKESESGNLSALIAKLDPIDREREHERARQRADEIIKARKGRLKKAYGISIWARATFDLSIPLLLAGAAMFALLTASPLIATGSAISVRKHAPVATWWLHGRI